MKKQSAKATRAKALTEPIAEKSLPIGGTSGNMVRRGKRLLASALCSFTSFWLWALSMSIFFSLSALASPWVKLHKSIIPSVAVRLVSYKNTLHLARGREAVMGG